MKFYCIILILLTRIFTIKSLTEIVSTRDCFSIASNPLKLFGVRIMSYPEKGKKTCYYSPPQNDYYFSILINNLNLNKINGVCPKLTLEVFQNVWYDLDPSNYIQLRFEVPLTPKLIFEADCTNFKSKIKNIVETTAPGDKVILYYDPGNEVAPSDAYFITLSAYMIGQSYSCPANKYRCWNSNFKCIDESLVCDNVDNCYDNSDENDYRCTGRLGDLPMPLFIIIIIAAILMLIFIMMVIILIMRNRKSAKYRKQEDGMKANSRTYEDETLPPHSYMS